MASQSVPGAALARQPGARNNGASGHLWLQSVATLVAESIRSSYFIDETYYFRHS
jgi:hypothetical protein